MISYRVSCHFLYFLRVFWLLLYHCYYFHYNYDVFHSLLALVYHHYHALILTVFFSLWSAGYHHYQYHGYHFDYDSRIIFTIIIIQIHRQVTIWLKFYTNWLVFYVCYFVSKVTRKKKYWRIVTKIRACLSTGQEAVD